jgi:hypothetical protein
VGRPASPPGCQGSRGCFGRVGEAISRPTDTSAAPAATIAAIGWIGLGITASTPATTPMIFPDGRLECFQGPVLSERWSGVLLGPDEDPSLPGGASGRLHHDPDRPAAPAARRSRISDFEAGRDRRRLPGGADCACGRPDRHDDGRRLKGLLHSDGGDHRADHDRPGRPCRGADSQRIDPVRAAMAACL